MTEGYIDSASTYEIVTTLRLNRILEVYPWAYCTAIEVTALLINAEYLKLAPSPGTSGLASGPYGFLMEKLVGIVSHAKPTESIVALSCERTRCWASRNTDLVHNAIISLRADEKNFLKWLEHSIIYAWKEHSVRLGGLFNPEFIPHISKAIKRPADYLSEVWKLSCNINVLDDFINRWPDTDEFKTMQDAYIASLLIRGCYHDYVAEGSKQDIVHHRVRQSVLSNLSSSPLIFFPVLDTQTILARAIVQGAFAESSHLGRIALWVENVEKARKAQLLGIIDLRKKLTLNIAKDAVKNAIKQADLRLHPKFVEEAIDTSIAMGVGLLTSFVLKEWISAGLSIGTYFFSRTKSIGKRVANSFYRSEHRLEQLVNSAAGRIESVWKND